MSIAIYIKSESCDSYLYSYDTGTSEEKIKDDLESDLDMFRPISDYTVQISDSESPSTETRVEIIMAEIFKKSWERDDDKKVKELSAGIIFMTEDKELFMGRVTGSRKPGMPAHKWDIPKGHVEADESPIEAAIRETEEETGFTQYDPAFLKDLGEFRYSDNKNLHLFLYTIPVEHEQFRHSKCSAYHTFPDGSSVPEFDAFALIKPSQWQYVMGKSMYKVMTQIFG